MTPSENYLSLLEKERRLIRQGAFEALEPLADRKARLARTLIREEIDPLILDKIRKTALENGRLMEAAARGIRSALSQVEDARSMTNQSTYDQAGHRQKISRSGTSLERKL